MIGIAGLVPHSREHHESAAWRHGAFLAEMGYSLADSYRQLEKITTQGDALEVALIARLEGKAVGICLLVREELDALHEVSPWLASLYVEPGFRKRGVARALIGAIEDHARGHGVDQLYLYTADAMDLYLKCGWHVRAQTMQGEEPLVLMEKRLRVQEWTQDGPTR